MEEKTKNILIIILAFVFGIAVGAIIYFIVKQFNKDDDSSSSKCKPNCTNLDCGDNGCGGTCGTCDDDQTCNNGRCVSSGGCTPDCTNLDCGDDGCGGTCGTCDDDETCNNGRCVSSGGCTPDCTNLNCGDDGCGGTCGTCDDDETCTNGKCVSSGGCTNAGDDMYITGDCINCCDGLKPYKVRDTGITSCSYHCYSDDDPNLPSYDSTGKTAGTLCSDGPVPAPSECST